MLKLHKNEFDIDASLVGRLIASQFPLWANLPIQPVLSLGTDHALYRLGSELVVRLPRIESAASHVAKEHLYLPQLSKILPFAIPTPLGKGVPSAHYPWPWSVFKWLGGENPTPGKLRNPKALAHDLARFINALHEIDLLNGPISKRGKPLNNVEGEFREALKNLDGIVDTKAAIALWEQALNLPIWTKPPVWVHGDLLPANLLIKDERLNAVIDFGMLGIGDPACDLIPAWSILPAEARKTFFEGLHVDHAMWERGRAWALSIGVIALPYYKDTHPVFASVARYMISEVIDEFVSET